MEGFKKVHRLQAQEFVGTAAVPTILSFGAAAGLTLSSPPVKSIIPILSCLGFGLILAVSRRWMSLTVDDGVAARLRPPTHNDPSLFCVPAVDAS